MRRLMWTLTFIAWAITFVLTLVFTTSITAPFLTVAAFFAGQVWGAPWDRAPSTEVARKR